MTVLFAITGAMALLSALGIVVSRQTIYSALSLVMTVASLAVLFLLLNAQFLFVVQLIVYAGAVVVLFVFIIALLSPEAEDRPAVDARLIVGLVMVAAMTAIVFGLARNGITMNPQTGLRGQTVGSVSDPYHTFSFPEADVNQAGNVQAIGGQLFTTYLLPFEVTSLLLLVAAIGAVYLTRRHASVGER